MNWDCNISAYEKMRTPKVQTDLIKEMAIHYYCMKQKKLSLDTPYVFRVFFCFFFFFGRLDLRHIFFPVDFFPVGALKITHSRPTWIINNAHLPCIYDHYGNPLRQISAYEKRHAAL